MNQTNRERHCCLERIVRSFALIASMEWWWVVASGVADTHYALCSSIHGHCVYWTTNSCTSNRCVCKLSQKKIKKNVKERENETVCYRFIKAVGSKNIRTNERIESSWIIISSNYSNGVCKHCVSNRISLNRSNWNTVNVEKERKKEMWCCCCCCYGCSNHTTNHCRLNETEWPPTRPMHY